MRPELYPKSLGRRFCSLEDLRLIFRSEEKKSYPSILYRMLRRDKLNVSEKENGEQPEDLSDHGHCSYRNRYATKRTP
jgi:hypothetical protein